MYSDTPPIATGLAVFCIFVFVVLVITFCCKRLAQIKAPDITLVPSQGRYVSTVDVQTGMPVVVDVSTLAAGSRRVATLPRRMSYDRPNHALYGSISQHPPCQSHCEVLPNTPPPPYSEVFKH